ncbi:MAG: glycosyltransferase family 4 protein [Bacteroidetes bacterium]|nr:glycosyltransferase family 4 protein [Bacteroidota bacterium]
MKKKICLIGPAYPYRGGNALFVAHLYSALSDKYNVHVINFTKLYPKFLFPGSRQEDISQVGVKTHPSERIINSTNPLTWFKAVRKIKQLNPDLIAFIWYNPFFGMAFNFIAGRLKKSFPGKTLFIAENIISHEARFVDSFLTNIALRHADKFLVLSEVVEKEIKELYPDKKVFRSSLPIYDCYQFDSSITKVTAREKINLSVDKNVILFFGYIRAYKGLMNLIEAMPKVLKYDNDTVLLIVGEFYEEKDKYLNEIEKLELGKNVKIIAEFVPNEDVGLYYTASDLVVLPYKSATQSGILNIAYGFKRPVVVTNVGGLPELVEEGKTGFIVEPNDPDALAEGIIKYFSLIDKSSFEKNIDEFVQKNSFKSIEDVFEQIV